MYNYFKIFFMTVTILFWVTTFALPAHAIDVDMAGATTPDESAVSQTIPVFLSSAHSSSITVNYTITDDTAIEGDDYTNNTTGILTFNAGDTVKSINIPIIQDAIDEDAERLFVNLISTSFGTIVTNQVSLTITDDDLPPTISIGDNTSSDESGTVTNLTATLSGASGKTITVDYATSDGTATAGDDYTAVSTTTLTFNPGETSKDIPITVISDDLDEFDETLFVSLSNASNVSISDGVGALTITDDDNPPTISTADVTTTGEDSAELVISLSAASEKNISVSVDASSGTATSGNDFNPFSTSVSFVAGETTKSISIPLINDGLDEDNETFTITLSGASNASISTSTATVTITDDDLAPILSIQDVSSTENNGTATATVALNSASAKSITVDYATSDDTATAGDDYTGISATALIFNPGETSKTINIVLSNDVIDENDETFTITLSSPNNATVSTTAGAATMTIVDDDNAPTISIGDNTSSDESGAVTNLLATLSAVSEKTITVDYVTSDGTATAGDDYIAVSTTTLTFNAGDTSKNIPITVVSDNIDEVDETVIVTLSNPSNVTINDAIGELTIADDDNAPAISIADVTIPNETAVPRVITVSLSAESAQTVEVDYATADGTAVAVNDYIATSGTVTFNPGETSQTISVTMVDDNLAEVDEVFNIDLSNPVNATISDNQSEVTITDDEGTPVLSVADASTSDETATNLVATVSLSGPSSQTITVDYATSDDTATAGDDYTAISATPLTFNPGDVSKTVNIAILSDVIDENDETFTITLSSPNNATVSTTAGAATMTIVDDDNAPTISIGDNTSSDESGAVTNLLATLSAASEKTITVDYVTSDGTATAGDDYIAVSTTTLTFNAGDTSKNIPITVVSDNINEVDETVIVTLSNPSNVTINDAIGELTIADDDGLPTISIADATIPNETSTPRTVTVSLSAESAQTVEVDYATADGTAVAVNDYIATSGTVTFNPGETSQTISVTMVDDNLAEVDEVFNIDLSNPVNATISDNQSEVTITDDEGTPVLSVADASTSDETATNLVATVSLSGPSSQTITVDYATSDDTATAGDDYTAISATPLTFNPGDVSKTVNIAILSDVIDENDETFTITLSSPNNATVSTTAGAATMTIVDDDNAPTISIGDNTSSDESGAVTNLLATLSAASEKTITVDYVTSDGTATAGDDYIAVSTTTLTFNAGDTSKNIPITVVSDNINEVDETVIVTLSNPSNVTINDAIGELTIADDDGLPTISIADATIPNETSTPRTVTVSLSAESAQTVEVDYATADGTAVAVNDYIATSGTVTFNPGETSQTISVTMVDDNLAEVDEVFNIDLSNPVNATISDNQSEVTITDDEGTPVLSVADASTSDETATNLVATVSLSGPSSQTITVDYATSDDTATAGDDYTAISATPLTFNPGDVSKTVNIAILSDVIDENDETFTITLSSPNNATVSTTAGAATMTIVDDDNAPTISIGDNTSSDESGAVTNLLATLSAASEKTITVDYVTSDGTATAGDDYIAVSTTTLTFNAGDTSKNIPITVVSDNINEVDETVIVTLSNPSNVTINDAIGELTIADDDGLPTISIADATIPNETAVPRVITVSLSAESAQTVEVDYATADGTAVAVNDYIATSGTVTFNPGETSQTISVTMVDDNLAEVDEVFNIDLSNPVNATISDNQSEVTITDDEGTPVLSVADASTSDETATNLVATVSLSRASSQTITVDYATSDDTATAGDDYTAISATPLTFNPGDVSKTVNIAILSDVIDENDETFTITLSSPNNATVSTTAGAATMTIVDDDNAPTISIGDNTSSDESGAVTNLVATLSAASEKTITVDYVTSDGTATAGDDYIAVSTTTLTFNAGDTSKNIPITVVSDNIDEVDETVIVTLSNPSNVTINDAIGELTIADDDGLPTISIADATIPNETAVSRAITLTLNPASAKTVTVDYSTSDGTAAVNSDYNSASGTASFSPGETTTTININILSDTLSEGDETFYVNLSNPTLATISDNQSEITITDGDTIPTISISDATTSDETAAGISTTVTLSNPSVSTISVNWATSDDTAIAGEDYNTAGGVLIFNPGEVSHTVPVNILADDIPEGIEAFKIILSNVTSGAIISDDTAVITITDDDGHPTISTESVSASEGSSNAMIDVELSHSSPLTISVDYATVNSSAIAGQDYTFTSGTLTFNPGEESKSISIPVLSDNVFEPTESFKVILSNPVNATISVGTSNVTLTDDDKLLSPAQSAVISDAILFGKNSSLRSETAFFGRILSRNTSLLASNQDVSDGPVMSFRNVQVDWSDLNEFAKGSFSFDNVKGGGTRNTSWETSVSHTKNESGTKNTFISTAFNFSRRNSKGTIYGLILGGGYSDTSMTGESIGTNLGRSLAAGVYAAYPIANSLIIDLMATKTLELNTLDTRVDDVLVNGDYNRNSTAFSVGLEGKMKIGSSEILPKFKYTVGKSVFDTGTFDIRKGALTSTQQIDFGTDEYFRFSFSPEFRTVLGNKGNLIRTYGFNRLSFRPKFFCEKYDYESSKKCGQGLGLTFGNHHPLYNFNQDFILDYDEIDGSKTYSVNYKRIY